MMMKKILSIVCFLISISIGATTYYCAPTGGNDDNPGTISQPWLNWSKAILTAQAGDTVYFRGGVYYPTEQMQGNNILYYNEGAGYGHSGTYADPICYFAYPPDWDASSFPIFDCSRIYTTGAFNTGLQIGDAHHIKFKGLTICNVYQRTAGVQAFGIVSEGGSNLSFENCNIHHIGGNALRYEIYLGYNGITYDTLKFINCDIYQSADSLSDTPGNAADGFKVFGQGGAYIYIYGCRSFDNADDGFDIGSGSRYVVVNNWSFQNGYLEYGDGSGFKNAVTDSVSFPPRIYVNNIIAMNSGVGIGEVDYDPYYRVNGRYYNNTIYNNSGTIGNLYNTPKPWLLSIFRNNLAYKDIDGIEYPVPGLNLPYVESHNTWDYWAESWPFWKVSDTVTVTDGDFVSMDSTQLRLPRKADGTLPDITFLKLSSTSDLIDAGTTYGYDEIETVIGVPELSYDGSTIDIGAFEYSTSAPASTNGIIKINNKILKYNGKIIGMGKPTVAETTQIIADHTVVDRYDDIPAEYIAEVKKLWLVIAGESHSEAYRTGLALLESSYPAYAVSVVDDGTPEAYTTSNLRASRATWGDYDNSSGWIYSYGEEDWWTNSTGVNRTKAGITYCNTHSLTIGAIGFGWCWDAQWGGGGLEVDPEYGVYWYGRSVGSPAGSTAWGLDNTDNAITGNSVNLDTYLTATQAYIDYCTTNGYSTKVFFTTGTVDNYDGFAEGEKGYQAYLKWERIRDYIKADTTRILFDYTDILCFDNDGTPTTTTWSGHTYPKGTTLNTGAEETGHITNVGALRLGKAMWWMLARMAGWDGN